MSDVTEATAPYGSWPSPISAAQVAAGGIGLAGPALRSDAEGRTEVWWSELRPAEGGRSVLVRRLPGSEPTDMIVAPWSARTRVHEYGGGAYAVRDGCIVFSEFADNRLMLKRTPDAAPVELVTDPALRFADLEIDAPRARVIAVLEDQRQSAIEARNLICAVSLSSGAITELTSGHDFASDPRLSPDGRHLAWLTWDFPQMPWDGTRLMIARLDGAALTDIRCLTGSADTPIFQPGFSPDGRWMSYIAQDGEWDRLYVVDLTSGKKRALAADAALLPPAWVQGMRTYAWSSDSTRLFFIRNDQGVGSLWTVGAASGSPEKMDLAPYTWLDQIASGAGDRLAFIVSSPQVPSRIVTWENGSTHVERYSESGLIVPEDLPFCQPITWLAPGGSGVHGLYYPPVSRTFTSDGLPPAIVHIHGGPTSAVAAGFNSDAAFFTTRGYGFLEVNYRGSTSYGRSYMLALRQKWGLLDVEDAVGGAQALGAMKLADPRRLVIMGGSAGGYTVLNALVRHPGVFKAGVCLYGLSNLFITETHKFEEKYSDSLIGVLPQDAERYRAWSPVNFADRIKDPVAVFQGLEDKVVPPEHSEQIVAALRANHVPHIYKAYEGEGHGWRKSETIADFYSTVDKFLKQYVIFA